MVASQCNDGWALWAKRFRQWDGLALIVGGGVVLIGWILDNDVLKRIIPGLVAMNPVTALGFMMAGISLLCFWHSRENGKESNAGRILAGVLVGMGALKIGQYLFGWPIAFDEVLFRTQLEGDPTGIPNQIAPNTAFSFVLGGLALWFLNGSPKRFSAPAQNLGLTLALVSLVPLIGYLYQASYLYSVGSYIPMALHTAVFFLLFAIGVLLAQSDDGVVALFMSDSPGGAVARRLLPVAFTIPVGLGALQICGEKSGVFPGEFGITLMVVASVATFGSLTWRTAALLNRSDSRRREAEECLRRAHDELEARVNERTAELHQSNAALLGQIAELQKAEERIREQAELLDKANDAIMVLDVGGRISFWNKGAELLYGWSQKELLGRNVRELLSKNDNGFPAVLGKVFEDGVWSGEIAHVTKDGRTVTVDSHWTLVRDSNGCPKSVLLIDTDITEKKQYQAQMLRSQRMDSIGTLAGGIAHDLNNALAPVLMSAEMLHYTENEADREKYINIITTSAQRGVQMVKQILSFARRSRGPSAPVPVGNLVSEMAKIVKNTFPKSISIGVNFSSRKLWNVTGDVTELHQVLLNLCVNARDAMPDGGRLTLSVENVRLDKHSAPSTNSPGPYVLVSVADTGTGIPPEVLPRIFEPFFTTKSPEKGTGLGLSTVASIVKHRRGLLDVKTDSGKGTEFRIYLPAVEAPETDKSELIDTPVPEGNGELILVMDDEESVREMTKSALESYGYKVVTALNGLHGIARFEEHKDDIRLVITDSDMPYLDGLSALCSIQQLKPGIPAIIASGTKHEPENFQQLDLSKIFNLGKPFGMKDLLSSVARMLDQPGGATSSARTALVDPKFQ
jgi:PAS domain S-box-containing protein